MRIELLTVGDELLDGLTVDTHTATVGAALGPLGLRLARSTTLRDDLEVLVAALSDLSTRCDICLMTGGLGPTDDDLAAEALAATAGVALHEDAEAWARIQARYAPREPPAVNRRQARVPEGGRALHSEVGTAPALELHVGRCTFFALPGVPVELGWHLENHVVPALRLLAPAPSVAQRLLRFAGITESDLASRVAALALPEGVAVGWRTGFAENQVRLRSPDAAALEHAARLIIAAASDAWVGADDAGLTEAVLDACRRRGLTLGAAESCTGGLLGATLSEVAGASEVFVGSIAAYANAAKTSALGVDAELLRREGAVSEACAAAMAAGARAALGCDVAVSITGIAGPGGGSPERPVGTVCLGWAGVEPSAPITVHLRGDRDAVRRRAVARALDGLRRRLAGRVGEALG